MSCKPRQLNKFISLLGVSIGGALSFGTLCIMRGDEDVYSRFLMPLVSKYIDPELAHDACIFFTKHKLIRCQDLSEEQAAKLKTRLFNMTFSSPIGIAAGFDKNSLSLPGIHHYGVGFTEVGTVTPKPQYGNPKRRIFRALHDQAIINRCGFNNLGFDFVIDNLSKHRHQSPIPVGINIGKNKDTLQDSSDYLLGIERFGLLESVDYIVVNISSPNTPGLRDMQAKACLEKFLMDLLAKMDSMSVEKPLLVKVSPDLSKQELKDIADIVMSKKCGEKKVNGIILTNTTLSRPTTEGSTHEKAYDEAGGLSGKPLRNMSTSMIRDFYKLTGGKIPIIGVGGVFSGQDAYDKIKAGASLVQLYTSLTYEGPPVVNKIKRELVELLERDKLASISEAVGLDHK